MIDARRVWLGVRDLGVFVEGSGSIQWRGAGLALRVGGGRCLVWPPDTEDVGQAVQPSTTEEAVRVLRGFAAMRRAA